MDAVIPVYGVTAFYFNTNDMETTKTIQEKQTEIKAMLDRLSDMTITADAEDYAYYFKYDNEDLLNALQIFIHVAKDIAIKAGHYKDFADAKAKMSDYHKAIKDAFGFDTHELTKSVFGSVENQNK